MPEYRRYYLVPHLKQRHQKQIALDCTGCAKQTMIRPFSARPDSRCSAEPPRPGAENPNPTVKEAGLLATPFTVTTTFPVVAPIGTAVTMLVEFQLTGVPPTPLKVSVLVPCVEPKLVPVIIKRHQSS